MIRVRIISFKLFTVIRHHEGCFFFPYACNVSNCTDQCFEPNAKRFVCSQNIPNGKQFICFQKVWYLSCKCFKNRHLFYEHVVEFNEQNEIRLVFSSWNVFELDCTLRCVLYLLISIIYWLVVLCFLEWPFFSSGWKQISCETFVID